MSTNSCGSNRVCVQPSMALVLRFACGGRLVVDATQAAHLGSEVLEAADCVPDDEEKGLLLNDSIADWRALLAVLARQQPPPPQPPQLQHQHEQHAPLDLAVEAPSLMHLADKYGMTGVLALLDAVLTSDAVSYSQAPSSTGDPACIWRWLGLASRYNRRRLLAHLTATIIERRFVAPSADELRQLHPHDAAELLAALMASHAAARFKCLSCVRRVGGTEVRLCADCAFAPHVRV